MHENGHFAYGGQVNTALTYYVYNNNCSSSAIDDVLVTTSQDTMYIILNLSTPAHPIVRNLYFLDYIIILILLMVSNVLSLTI